MTYLRISLRKIENEYVYYSQNTYTVEIPSCEDIKACKKAMISVPVFLHV